MHVLLIIIFTPLAIVLGLILLRLVFSRRAWRAVGYTGLGLVAFLIFAVLIVPKPPPPAAPALRSTIVPVAPPSPAAIAERAALVKSSKWDYPYLRAWAELQDWSQREFDDAIKSARRNKAPPDTVHSRSGGHWVTIEDLENETIRSILTKTVKNE
jgi:hypothetical protein